MNTALVKFTPDLAVLFAVGLLAAGIVTAGERTRVTALGRLRAGRRGAGHRVDGGQGLRLVDTSICSGSTWPGLRRSAASSPRSPPRARGSSSVSLTAACRGASAPAPTACTSRTRRSSIAVSYGAGAGPRRRRDADVLRAGRDPAARDRVLRPAVRRRVRAPLPAAPRVDPAPAGDVGPAAAAAARSQSRRCPSPGAGGSGR